MGLLLKRLQVDIYGIAVGITLWYAVPEIWKHIILNGKTHYFYGHVQ